MALRLSPAPLIALSALFAVLIPSDADAAVGYVRSTIAAPWGSNANEQAMDLAFGAGGWDDLRYETVNPALLFSDTYTFLYLEGSDSNALELEAFLAANQGQLEGWVAAGGGLFLNAAPNEGAAQNWGFGGVALDYPNLSANPGTPVDAMHAIWNGPNLPIALMWTGGSYAHASVAGPGLIPHIEDNDGNVNLAELTGVGGRVMFGGLTTSNFWDPAPESLNLRANILVYIAEGAQGCGNGAVDMGEACDDAGESATCNDDCTLAVCGDLIINATAGETCDDGARTATCNDDCTLVSCGDGVLNMTAGEECDDGNKEDTDACIDCLAAFCGDGFVQTGLEQCDDANKDDTDACVSCSNAICGDGVVQAGVEECDDGGTDDGDGCAADCTEEVGSTGGAESGGSESGGAESGGAESGGADGSTGGGGGTGGGGDDGPVTTVTPTTAGDTGAETGGETGADGGARGGEDDGCSCRSDASQNTPWGLFALFGIGAIGRRRRR